MLNIFKEKIKEIHTIILQPIDSMYKIIAIHNLKKTFNMPKEQSFGKAYFAMLLNNKEQGVVYTPKELAQYMIENTIKKEEIIKNPWLKIVDPSCGTGNIIVPCFQYLNQVFSENLVEINEQHRLSLKPEEIGTHILKHNLYGYDIDATALEVLTIDLYEESLAFSEVNFIEKDFLLEEIKERYHIVIGNPPYIGQKSIEKEYGSKIKKAYKEIYKDKGDLCYCFFQKALNILEKSGKLTFVTSRYFLEAPSGEVLRTILKEVCSLQTIVDFYGIRPFKKIGIDPVIVFLNNEQYQNQYIEVIKPLLSNGKNDKNFCEALFSAKEEGLNRFTVNKSHLNNKGWILRNEQERNIINKIEEKCFTHLVNICKSYQGIITGCDGAFVVNAATIEKKGIEQGLIKPWIKSSYIEKNQISMKDNFLIYADLIQEQQQYPRAIEHIHLQKEKLIKRRECRSGKRKWYELQWGRLAHIFEEKKIIFPFKSNHNRFALSKGIYFSADVYALGLKENAPFTYEYLLFLLNSPLYEYYFKTFAKKLGEDQYEYYPNNLMKICIPTMFSYEGKGAEFLYEYFELSKEEIKIIESYI